MPTTPTPAPTTAPALTAAPTTAAPTTTTATGPLTSLRASRDMGTTDAHGTKYKITIWAEDATGAPVSGKLVSWVINGVETVSGRTDAAGTVNHDVVAKPGENLVYQAFVRSDGVCSNTLDLKGPKNPNPVKTVFKNIWNRDNGKFGLLKS